MGNAFMFNFCPLNSIQFVPAVKKNAYPKKWEIYTLEYVEVFTKFLI